MCLSTAYKTSDPDCVIMEYISRIDVDILTFFQFSWITVLDSVFLPFFSSSYSRLLIAVVVSFSWVKVGSRLVVFTNSDKGQQFFELLLG